MEVIGAEKNEATKTLERFLASVDKLEAVVQNTAPRNIDPTRMALEPTYTTRAILPYSGKGIKKALTLSAAVGFDILKAGTWTYVALEIYKRL